MFLHECQLKINHLLKTLKKQEKRGYCVFDEDRRSGWWEVFKRAVWQEKQSVCVWTVQGQHPGDEPTKSNTWLSVRFTFRQMSSSGVGLNIWRASPCFNVCDRGIWCFPLPNTYQMTILVSTLVQSKAKVGENFFCWANLGCVWSQTRTHDSTMRNRPVTAESIMCTHLSNIPLTLVLLDSINWIMSGY